MNRFWHDPLLFGIVAAEIVIAVVCIRHTARKAYEFTSLKVSQSFRRMIESRIEDISRYQVIINAALARGQEREALKRLLHWMSIESSFLLAGFNESLKESE